MINSLFALSGGENKVDDLVSAIDDQPSGDLFRRAGELDHEIFLIIYTEFVNDG
jgi:hypothetical protein